MSESTVLPGPSGEWLQVIGLRGLTPEQRESYLSALLDAQDHDDDFHQNLPRFLTIGEDTISLIAVFLLSDETEAYALGWNCITSINGNNILIEFDEYYQNYRYLKV